MNKRDYMNKKGWMKIVEAFVAILLIASVTIIVISRGQVEEVDISEKVYEAEISILREVQLNNTLRTDTLTLEDSVLPIEEDEPGFPSRIKERTLRRTPNYLECKVKICKINEPCFLNEYPQKNTYAQSVVITSTLEIYNPRQVKIFCWTK